MSRETWHVFYFVTHVTLVTLTWSGIDEKSIMSCTLHVTCKKKQIYSITKPGTLPSFKYVN
ncbi:hypothetical protein HanIR_Chr06g0272141 [Helianthus annuus]|nr:hypothetical protein HanIR_Chr06g0272141 [Helianthus annuus]